MKKKNILGVLAVTILGLGIAMPAFSAGTPKVIPKTVKIEKNVKSEKAQKAQKAQSAADAVVNPLYPKKYNAAYIANIKEDYKIVGKNEVFYVALDMLKGTNGEFSRRAILGSNLTQKPVKVEFKDLSTINKNYASYDALGWKKGSRLYIYINQKHSEAPAIALAALLSHEALHQDEYNSLSEETYAWTMEAAVWCELLGLYPDYQLDLQPLVQRENTLKKLFEKGDYTDKYIKKTVYSNAGYQNLPESSPGFEAL